VWNLHPAKVFMGDLGSLALGGALCAIAFGIGRPLYLIPIGLIYIAETMSVMLQVGYFKLTHGKRLFKMSPIHHHFEMCGWKENKIVLVFSAVTLLGAAGTILLELFA
jgi:phospho-N-acetylmuramoyl-pentapeptide-transferase